jgi:hypothetical protein
MDALTSASFCGYNNGMVHGLSERAVLRPIIARRFAHAGSRRDDI